jgi:hypothetical protein
VNEAYRQLTRCGALVYMRDTDVVGEKVYAKVDLRIIEALATNPKFLSGPLHRLHRDVNRDGIKDKNSCEFRSIRGSFGRGSVQIVINIPTCSLEADVDAYSPYDDGVGFFGHAWEVISSLWKRQPKETECSRS